MTVRRLILLLLLPACALGQQQYYGTRVSSLSLSGAPTQSDLQNLPLKSGDLMSMDNVRASIQALYNTGRYSYIEVDATPEGSGTHIEFVVKPFFFFSTIRLQPENLLDRPLSGILRLPYGEKYSKSATDRIAAETGDLLRNEGYLEATISPEVKFDQSRMLAEVTLRAENVRRAIIGDIKIVGGEETFPDRKPLYDGFGLHAGRNYTADSADKGIRKIREKFVDLKFGSFLNTRVEVKKEYHSETNTVDLNI